MITRLVDLIAVGLQGYLIATFICRLYRVRVPYERSRFFAFIQLTAAYIVTNYVFCVTFAEKIISGILLFVIFGFLFFEGSVLYKIMAGVTEYMIFCSLDLILMLLFSDLREIIQSMPMAEQQLLGRNLLTTVVFFGCLVQEFILYRKKEQYNKWITGLGISIGIVQFIIWTTLSKTNTWGLIENRLIVTVLFSFALMGGYGIVTKLYKSYFYQKEKANEIEQMRLEIIYQKNYYLNAVRQGEVLRNVRHDIRNQLQMVEFILYSEKEKDSEKVSQLLDEVKRRINILSVEEVKDDFNNK